MCSLCLSKGLGAPIGSLAVGTKSELREFLFKKRGREGDLFIARTVIHVAAILLSINQAHYNCPIRDVQNLSIKLSVKGRCWVVDGDKQASWLLQVREKVHTLSLADGKSSLSIALLVV